MKKYDKMVLSAIGKEFDVKQSKITFLESFSNNGIITRLTFKIRYNCFENIVYQCECKPYFTTNNVILINIERIGTYEEYIKKC